MNRQILFRGKNATTEDWHEGFYFFHKERNQHIILTLIDGVDKFVEVIPETVGQFTGLTDKNGKKIFEGDLLDFDEKEWGGKFTPEAIFIETLICYGICGSLSDIKEWRKVIGNIHDNPNLLNK